MFSGTIATESAAHEYVRAAIQGSRFEEHRLKKHIKGLTVPSELLNGREEMTGKDTCLTFAALRKRRDEFEIGKWNIEKRYQSSSEQLSPATRHDHLITPCYSLKPIRFHLLARYYHEFRAESTCNTTDASIQVRMLTRGISKLRLLIEEAQAR